jgi:hypothetical protein
MRLVSIRGIVVACLACAVGIDVAIVGDTTSRGRTGVLAGGTVVAGPPEHAARTTVTNPSMAIKPVLSFKRVSSQSVASFHPESHMAYLWKK